MSSLALYIHVPFCGQRCSYCHFDIKVLHPQSDFDAFQQRYVVALQQEMRAYAAEVGERPLHSVFFGGGTPSRLSLPALRVLVQTLRECFVTVPDCEWSMEVNPEDAVPGYLAQLRALGLTRVSFGVQTFDARGLRALKRPHGPEQAQRALTACRELDFYHGFSLDLMLGLPFQTRATLAEDLALVRRLEPDHVSVYMLETDLPTSLDKTRAKLPMPSEDRQADWYEWVVAELGAAGLEHYEISNFAKIGFRSRHNLTYWRRGDYLGLGPAAHGTLGGRYWANHGHLAVWQRAVAEKGKGVAEEEHHDAARRRSEQLIQGFRLMDGVPLHDLSAAQQQALAPYEGAGLLHRRGARIALTTKGCLLANEVFTALLDGDAAP
ncbi:radical SAM family heme chaperone HemW [Acanthopleuribacter pedis]|uniref:Heme chaperone HemW n=1 Tax=Acanthopleuribacter pedis TaxID=442870 RepID=A0A8J7QGV5_9BACT|nr:radical SAM family heme chaperone HemW [Acanthopleuribacter pedis]MBO1318355.1 radical SAM family heme chaperone HemW [Acanthopleuribacter pedis]